MGGDELASERELVVLELCRHDRLTPGRGRVQLGCDVVGEPQRSASASSLPSSARPALLGRGVAHREHAARRSPAGCSPSSSAARSSSCSRSRSPNSPRSLPSTPSALASACASVRASSIATASDASASSSVAPYCAECASKSSVDRWYTCSAFASADALLAQPADERDRPCLVGVLGRQRRRTGRRAARRSAEQVLVTLGEELANCSPKPGSSGSRLNPPPPAPPSSSL